MCVCADLRGAFGVARACAPDDCSSGPYPLLAPRLRSCHSSPWAPGSGASPRCAPHRPHSRSSSPSGSHTSCLPLTLSCPSGTTSSSPALLPPSARPAHSSPPPVIVVVVAAAAAAALGLAVLAVLAVVATVATEGEGRVQPSLDLTGRRQCHSRWGWGCWCLGEAGLRRTGPVWKTPRKRRQTSSSINVSENAKYIIECVHVCG